MKFIIYKVNNGYLLNTYIKDKTSSYIFTLDERVRMFAYIDKLLGKDPYDQKEQEENKEEEQ